MSVVVEQVWSVRPSSEWTALIRADLDARLGLSLDYDGTIDGAWTAQAGELAARVDQRMADAIAATLLATAPRARVVAQARDAGLTPRAATHSTMEVALATGAGGLLPVGTSLRVRSGTVLYYDVEAGGITVPLTSTWTVIENVHVGDLLAPSDTVVVQCDQAGQVTIDGTVTFGPATPISGIGTLTGDVLLTTGRDAERLPELRARLASGRPGGAPAGLVAAVRTLPWVVSVGIVSTAGEIRVTVTPPPPTDAAEVALGEAIYRAHPAGTVTLGSESVDVEGADGRPVTVRYDVGTTQAVTVAFSVTPASTVADADARTAARLAIEEVFGRLAPGETLRYLRAIGALDQPAILGASLTLDGGTSDVVPSTAATLLVPVFA